MRHQTPRPLTDQIRRHNERLDDRLRRTVGIDLATYKTIAAVTRLLGVLLGGYALIYSSMDPATALTLTTIMVLGPDGFEAWLANRRE